MKKSIAILAMLGSLSLPLFARPSLSQEEAARMIKEGKTLRTSVSAPRSTAAWVGSVDNSEWKRTHLEAEQNTAYWKATAQGGVMEAEIPKSVWGKSFKVVLESHLRQGTLQGFVVSKEGLQIRDVVTRNAPGAGEATVKAESMVSCPPNGARLRLETSPGSLLRIDSVTFFVIP